MSRPDDFPEYQINKNTITEDGFCTECDEFYSECMCSAYFCRLINKQRRTMAKQTKQLKEAELELVEVKNTLLKLTKENCKLKQLLLEDEEL